MVDKVTGESVFHLYCEVPYTGATVLGPQPWEVSKENGKGRGGKHVPEEEGELCDKVALYLYNIFLCELTM